MNISVSSQPNVEKQFLSVISFPVNAFKPVPLFKSYSEQSVINRKALS